MNKIILASLVLLGICLSFTSAAKLRKIKSNSEPIFNPEQEQQKCIDSCGDISKLKKFFIEMSANTPKVVCVCVGMPLDKVNAHDI